MLRMLLNGLLAGLATWLACVYLLAIIIVMAH